MKFRLQGKTAVDCLHSHLYSSAPTNWLNDEREEPISGHILFPVSFLLMSVDWLCPSLSHLSGKEKLDYVSGTSWSVRIWSTLVNYIREQLSLVRRLDNRFVSTSGAFKCCHCQSRSSFALQHFHGNVNMACLPRSKIISASAKVKPAHGAHA